MFVLGQAGGDASLNPGEQAMDNKVVSRAKWLAARKELLVKEKEMTRQLDALRAERRTLPWVRVEKTYVFNGPEGKRALADLFDGRSQLAIYHFMLTPGSHHICPGCSFISDHIDSARQHFVNADLSFAALSRAPMSQIEPIKKRMGWRFPWLSSHGGGFNYDFGVSFTLEDIAAGRAIYKYTTPVQSSEDLHGTSIFARDDKGGIYHTYSTYARGSELMDGAFMWLDLTPKGRNEVDGIMSWVRLHDEYEAHSTGADDRCH
jgi:predicted dithiol-disulfide oxidoreductase (DUF899 family)